MISDLYSETKGSRFKKKVNLTSFCMYTAVYEWHYRSPAIIKLMNSCFISFYHAEQILESQSFCTVAI